MNPKYWLRFILWCASGLITFWGSTAHGEVDLGPIYDRFPLVLVPGDRTEVLGPLVSWESAESERGWGLHPLIYRRSDPVADFTEFDLSYPLLSYDRFGGSYRVHFLQLLSWSGGPSGDEEHKRRFTLFPLVFSQRSTDPDSNYFAIVPFYGRLKGRLLRDDIRFVLFPLYSKTRKKDVTTVNYLYPVFHKRTGDGLAGWQAWPLIGKETKALTIRTNSFGEAENIGGHEKQFALWPLYFKQRLGLGMEDEQLQQAIVPLFSIHRSRMRDSTTYFWPLGFTRTEDREKKYREWGMPWPLIIVARGEGKTADRIWPFFSRAKTPTAQSEFYAWPLYKRNRITSDPLFRERTRLLLFLYSDLVERNTTTGTALERKDLWPLFTHRRDHSGNERLQVLSILEPLIPNNKSIERNDSPLWSVWRSERNARTGESSQSLLWNFYRRETRKESRKVSLLFGLVKHQTGPEGNRWRIFNIPAGK